METKKVRLIDADGAEVHSGEIVPTEAAHIILWDKRAFTHESTDEDQTEVYREVVIITLIKQDN